MKPKSVHCQHKAFIFRFCNGVWHTSNQTEMAQTPYYIYGDTWASLHPPEVLYLPTQQFPDPSQSPTECPGYRNAQEPAYNDPHQGSGTPVQWKGVQVFKTPPSRLPVRLLVTTEPHLVDAASMNHGEHLPHMTRLCYSIIR